MSTEKISGQTIEFRKNDLLPLLFGAHNAHLHYLEDRLGIDIADRGNRLTLSGDAGAIKTAEHILNRLWNKIEQNHEVGTAEIDAELRFLEDKEKPKTQEQKDKAMFKDDIVIKTKKKTIVARSPNQALYMRSILDHEMVFGLGPAGTGKTYLAVAVGVSMYLEGKVERLIFARPAVEAGERLGFLPGDMKDKVDPYLRPIYDALHDMMPYDFMVKKIEDGDIEIAPLAFMRGRTLSNAFVILDEAQNTT
ncbi:MAG: PhoH family protein, partial [Alphaproteobacteria bacterium]|nr:PhoH family protein [Alphaproteobacteria bacterium]